MGIRSVWFGAVAVIVMASGCGGSGSGGTAGKGGSIGGAGRGGAGGQGGTAAGSSGSGTAGAGGTSAAAGRGGGDMGGIGGDAGGGGGNGGSSGVGGAGASGGSNGGAGMGGAIGGSGGGVGGSGGGGTTGSAGTTGTGGAPGTPWCFGVVTAMGMEPAKGVPCDPAVDINVCYRTCGPVKAGYKSETCTTALSYQEMSGCTFPPGDYSCFKIPTTANTVCPVGTPRGSDPCDVPECTACNSTGGLEGGQYFDSTSAAKAGFCVCQAPNANGARTWSCAMNNGSWPCPLADGCGVGGAGGAGGTQGGAGGSTGGSTSGGQPSCIGMLTVSSNMEPAKGIPCDPAVDVNVCYRTCGPEKKGYKAETCTTALSYQEMSGCTYDPGDYSCYRIPPTANAACPAGVTPKGADPCDVPTCTVCNSTGGLDGGQYLDSTGAAKSGFCVCQAPNASGTRTWSCAASNGSWPCPLQTGC